MDRAALCILAAVLSACAPPSEQRGAAPADIHTSQNSLDWSGVYEGVLPCADCPGIQTRLTLNRDGTYELLTRYLERPVAPRTERGRFTWQAGGNTIALDAGGQRYAVGEGRLSLLDPEGRPEWSPAKNRVLTLVQQR